MSPPLQSIYPSGHSHQTELPRKKEGRKERKVRSREKELELLENQTLQQITILGRSILRLTSAVWSHLCFFLPVNLRLLQPDASLPRKHCLACPHALTIQETPASFSRLQSYPPHALLATLPTCGTCTPEPGPRARASPGCRRAAALWPVLCC